MRAGSLAATIAIVVQLSVSSAQSSRLVFQDNFWVNLHHFLRGEAARALNYSPLEFPAERLSDQQRARWQSALDTYAQFVGRELFRDESFIQITNALSSRGDLTLLKTNMVSAPIEIALNRAAPIYRARLWADHRRTNEAWIAAVWARVDRHGAAMAKALADAYGVEWPSQPVLVDAVFEAGPQGGYTTDGPVGTAAHTIIAAANPEYQDDMGFEMVFHEASHARGIDDRIRGRIIDESERQHLTEPPNLWHALIFYTTGELARRELGKIDDGTYQPYAYRYGVYDRGWQRYRTALERDWRPYLDGRASFPDALRDLVRDAAP